MEIPHEREIETGARLPPAGARWSPSLLQPVSSLKTGSRRALDGGEVRPDSLASRTTAATFEHEAPMPGLHEVFGTHSCRDENGLERATDTSSRGERRQQISRSERQSEPARPEEGG